MPVPAPLELHYETVLPEWIDYNGHMNVAYYVLAFDHATDEFYDFLGLGREYREQTDGSVFAVECHVTYQREVKQGDPLRFTTQLLGFDDKRIQFIHRMYHANDGYLVATSEWLGLHVNLAERRVRPMPAAITSRLDDVLSSHRALPLPAEVGKAIPGIS